MSASRCISTCCLLQCKFLLRSHTWLAFGFCGITLPLPSHDEPTVLPRAPAAPKKHFCFYRVAGGSSAISVFIVCSDRHWLASPWIFFFSHEYVLITRSLVLLKIVMTFVSRVFLLLEKALAKASLKCISGCDEQGVRSALLARCAGALRQEKETITSCCQNNSFCVFFSESIRAKSPTHWSQGKDSCCFAQLWIKATVQRHDFSVG